MKKIDSKLFLYSGLALLLVSLVLRIFGLSAIAWTSFLGLAVVLKSVFLFDVMRVKEFKMSLWLVLILAGVVMILVSLLFKYVFPMPLLRSILFYGAITLKVSGLILMFVERVNNQRDGNKSA
ncbi:hypothetical protein D0T49_03410 [Paludibacter sp. 221]|uniref:hypothetical protein n=1 Tax=Paludibacter sp. 221 TaxID=2302939 RepID=UPI0013D69F09|nr:hypothetical protein [Paludibacter sp. 221]NDV46088.1 hypothetical protein [Paludibacter sp. 221]